MSSPAQGNPTKLCPHCGQPMLKKGQKREHPDEYRHAQGCPYSRKKTKSECVANVVLKGETQPAKPEIPEDLQKAWMARHLLEPPASEVVGELIERISRLEAEKKQIARDALHEALANEMLADENRQLREQSDKRKESADDNKSIRRNDRS